MKIIIILLLALSPLSLMAKKHLVTQKNTTFLKDGKTVKTLDVKMGDTIEFRNDETDLTHNVYSFSKGNTFDLLTQKPKASSTIELKAGKHKPGTMKVQCAIHPKMVLNVNIK